MNTNPYGAGSPQNVKNKVSKPKKSIYETLMNKKTDQNLKGTSKQSMQTKFGGRGSISKESRDDDSNQFSKPQVIHSLKSLKIGHKVKSPSKGTGQIDKMLSQVNKG